MSYVPKPNTGTLWPNDRKASQSHPDVRGDVHLDRAFLKDMMSKSSDDLVKIQIAGWNKVINGQNCLSISASAPYVRPQGGYQSSGNPAPVSGDPNEDVPF
jgi:hypothetical protein